MITITMTKDKTTKGTVRYSDQAKPFPHCIYLRKDELKPAIPNSITVTISTTKGGE